MNIVFKNPHFLWLLAVVVIAGLLYWFYRFKARSAVKISLPYQFENKTDIKTKTAEIIPLSLRFLALIILIFALARPQEIKRTVVLPEAGVDIILCLDTSTSMQGLDFHPFNRLQAAKKTAKEFINKRVNDRIGIVVFAEAALLVCPLTFDYQALTEFLDTVQIGMTYTDGTAIGDAIATSVNHIKESAAKSKVIILLTDGRSNSGEISNPVLAAKAAAEFNIKIYTVGTAAKGKVKFPVNDPVFGQRFVYGESDLDEKTLSEISKVTKAVFYRAENYKELQNIYSEINSLEKTHFKNPVTLDYKDKHQGLLLAAVLALLLEFILNFFIFVRIP